MRSFKCWTREDVEKREVLAILKKIEADSVVRFQCALIEFRNNVILSNSIHFSLNCVLVVRIHRYLHDTDTLLETSA